MSKNGKTTKCITAQIGQMDAIQNIRDEHWALPEWNIESMSIITMMEKVLRRNNKPMSVKDITKEVVEILPDAKISSIRSYSYKDRYDRLDDGRVILTEWKNKYTKGSVLTMVVNFDNLYVKFDTEGIDMTEDEMYTLTSTISNCEGVEKFDVKDSPRVRQTINDTMDTLNKGGELSNAVVENITYSIWKSKE